MRLSRLSLTRFGHFTNYVLDLPRTDRTDFHVILGPNEAGKSTIVESWLNLLYGIPARSNYAFRHARDTLEVAARIEDGADTYSLTRLRKASNSLTDPEGAPLPETILTGLLRGVQEDAYRHLYCLDDETIEKGGDDILASKGDLGQLLFSAASGLSAFNDMLESERVADRAFHIPRGSGRRGTQLYKLGQSLREIEARMKEIDLTAQDYRRLRDEVSRAQDAEAAAKEAHSKLIAEEQTLRAQLKALPIKAERDRIVEKLAALGPQPNLASQIAAEMAQLSEQRDAHLATIRTRRVDLETWATEREKFKVDPRADGLAEALEALTPLRSRVLNAAEDLPRRIDERDEIDRRLRSLLAEIGHPETDAASLGLTRAKLDRLDRAVQAHARSNQRYAAAQQEHAIAKDTVAKHREARPSEGETTIDPDTLETTLRQLNAGPIAERLDAARQHFEKVHDLAERAIAKLTVGGHSVEQPGRVPVTSKAATDLANTIAQHTGQLGMLEQRLAEDDRRVSALAAELAALQKQGAAPNDQEASALRETRDRLWVQHRTTLSSETADAYASARDTDDHATALRLSEASRLADIRRVDRDHVRCVAERDARVREKSKLELAQQRALTRLAGFLDEIGLPNGLTASDLADWLIAHTEAVEACRLRHEAQSRLTDAMASAQPLVQQLAKVFEIEPKDLGLLVPEAQLKLAKARTQRDLDAAKAQSLRAAEDALSVRTTALTDAVAECDAAQSELSDALATFDFTLPAEISVEDAIPRLRDIQTEAEKRASLADRIGKMIGNATDFADKIAVLSAPWSELNAKSALEQAAALDSIIAAHRRATERHQDLDEETTRARITIQHAEADQKRIENRAAEISQAWDADTRPKGFDAIATAVKFAETATDLRQQIIANEKALCSALEVDSLETAEAVISGAVESQLQSRLDLLGPDLKQAQETRDAAIRRLSLADKALSDISGDDDVARLAQDRQLLLEEIRSAADTGLQRRIGLILAERSLAQYRDHHRGEMLAATEAAFIDLTAGAYSGLSSQRDGSRETLIVHRASDGRSLRADEETMSKGTRFQLYFALRLAGYRQLAKAGTVLPFLCDDIFETFDEGRTAAACRLMGQIGEIGQALYFTHHAHVAQIAERECPGVVVHRLPQSQI